MNGIEHSFDFYVFRLAINIWAPDQTLYLSGQALNQLQWAKMHEVNHERFKNKFGGQGFLAYSVKIWEKEEYM